MPTEVWQTSSPNTTGRFYFVFVFVLPGSTFFSGRLPETWIVGEQICMKCNTKISRYCSDESFVKTLRTPYPGAKLYADVLLPIEESWKKIGMFDPRAHEQVFKTEANLELFAVTAVARWFATNLEYTKRMLDVADALPVRAEASVHLLGGRLGTVLTEHAESVDGTSSLWSRKRCE